MAPRRQRFPCIHCGEFHLNKGKWSRQEDEMLLGFIYAHGTDKWKELPKETGIQRCSVSCQKRWRNYLCPNVKRGFFTDEEEDYIIKLQFFFGNRWKFIADNIPGRTPTVIMNHCKSKRMREKLLAQEEIYSRKVLEVPGDHNLQYQEVPKVDLQLTIGPPNPLDT